MPHFLGANINMTAPVIIKVNASATMWQSSVYVLSFLLPSEYQANPPKPTDPSVSLWDILLDILPHLPPFINHLQCIFRYTSQTLRI